MRDVSGKEIAIYSGSSLVQWNIWGLDNMGKINADTTRNYYLKDHLGSIRVVLNSTNQVISAQDYDAWGYPLENRTYNATAMKYDFTGKERDQQTTYDYFGARYYDSRIGRWGGVDPQTSKNPSVTPYQYGRLNPLAFVDPNGMEEIKIIVRSYIPTPFVDYFKGDNRYGPELNTENFRTEHIVTIETDPTKSMNPKIRSDVFNVGMTIGLQGDFPHLRTGFAIPTYTSGATRSDDNQFININIQGAASDPLVENAPPATYDLNITLNIDPSGNITGGNFNVEHTKYPAFEVFIVRENGQGELQYDYPNQFFSPPNNPILGPLWLYQKSYAETAGGAIQK